MGKRKASRPISRPEKRRFSGNQFLETVTEAEVCQQAAEPDDGIFENFEFSASSSLSKIHGLPFGDNEDSSGSDNSDDGVDSDEDDDDESTLEGSRIIHLPALRDLLSEAAVCRLCNEGDLVLEALEVWPCTRVTTYLLVMWSCYQQSPIQTDKSAQDSDELGQ
eukprot:scpid94081/ scgid34653/ 